MAKVTDQQLADALAAFRERPKAEQQANVVWQELASFPEWASAQYRDSSEPRPEPRPVATRATEAPPDPRLPSQQRADIAKEQGTMTDDSKAKKPAVGSMVTGGQNRPNPWSQSRCPDGSGPAFIGINVNEPPPWPGKWRRVEGGWFRDAS
jgi:hypothetical protein